MKKLVIYGGRFHPFHKGHKSVYDYLTKKFDPESVYVVTSGVQAPVTSPFTFSDKLDMMSKLGIPPGKIAQVKNPYQAKEITEEVDDAEGTILIFAVSEKDMQPGKERFKFGTKKDGTPSYLQPMPEDGKKMKPMTKHGYVVIVPKISFKVQDADADSATQIRKAYIDGNDSDRENIITDLYGSNDRDLKRIFDQRLLVTENTQKFISESKTQLINANLSQKKKIVAVLESVIRMEQQVDIVENDDLLEDYIDEK